eukprot:gnl/Spiro4/22685_TR11196_c0_g1_i1.p1 gnl/Spiro4/22685_TR11196_c0_g1~~gnl/Spiro4/22685_TR11196_c0_g1_i1.p1  ORF type:complete len:453 (+),score=-52.83 gnl/Spiro4/22685_TR11196_c0_g1_i1:419-1777(+)
MLHSLYDDQSLRDKKITLAVRNATVREVIELIGDSVGLNMVVDPEVTGMVPLFNVKEVEAGVALRILLSNNKPSLALLNDQGVWRITTKNMAHEFLASHMQELEITNFEHGSITLQHLKWTENFKQQATKMWVSLTDCETASAGNSYLVFEDESRKIFFGGKKNALKVFKDFLNEIDIKIPQINIEARIVVADKQFEDSFGIQWSGIYNRKASVNRGFDFVGIGPLNDIQNTPPSSLSNLMDWALNLFPTPWAKGKNTQIPVVFGGGNLNTTRLNLVLNAAENRHEIRTILKPSILTSDREVAEVLEGEVIPIETIIEESIEGRLRNMTTASYKDVGIQLKVKPTVSADQKSVMLDVFVENSMVGESLQTGNSSAGSVSYPTIATTRSKTKVLLANGQTTMIGGLIRNRKGHEETRLPVISKIPLIGWLFKGSKKTVRDMQLLIFVTPTVVT